MGGGSGSAGISALLPRQLCFCRMHSEKSSSSCDSCDTMQRYEHTCSIAHVCDVLTQCLEWCFPQIAVRERYGLIPLACAAQQRVVLEAASIPSHQSGEV